MAAKFTAIMRTWFIPVTRCISVCITAFIQTLLFQGHNQYLML